MMNSRLQQTELLPGPTKRILLQNVWRQSVYTWILVKKWIFFFLKIGNFNFLT